jgi:Flp pilus assembly protein TadG
MEDEPMQKPGVFRRNGERGQSLIEFAIGLVVLLIIVAGVFDAARALFTYLALRDAAQEGALYGSIDPTNFTEIRERACSASNMMEDLCAADNPNSGNGFEIEIIATVSGKFCMGSTGPNSHGIQVTVDYPNFPLTMPLIGELIGRQNTYTVPITAIIRDTIITPACP